MAERFFVPCEEIDVCVRLRQAAWEILHGPPLTILTTGQGRPGSEGVRARGSLRTRARPSQGPLFAAATIIFAPGPHEGGLVATVSRVQTSEVRLRDSAQPFARS
jgi:hypothetical protein